MPVGILAWDGAGDRVYETGVDHGVLYIPNGSGVYNDGVAWNGLTSVEEAPTGGEATKTYADNIAYLTLTSLEEWAGTINAYTYPDEFYQFEGVATPQPGVMVSQQVRKTFGFSWRSRIGDDLEGDAAGYKLHLVYGAMVAPTSKTYATVNDSPEATEFSWEVTTTAVAVTALRPTSKITIDSRTADPTDLAALQTLLYGAVATAPALPTPNEVIALFTP